MADAGRPPGQPDPRKGLEEPDYRHELQRYAARSGSGYLQTNEIQWPWGAIALVNGFFIAVFGLLRFVLGSWIRWWRAEPRGAALYTLASAVVVALWLTWPSAPGHAIAADGPLWLRLAIAIAGVLVVGGIPGAFFAKWRVSRGKAAPV